MEKAAEITISYKPRKGVPATLRIANSKDAFNAIYPHFDPDTIHIQEQFLVAYLCQNILVKGVYSGFRGGITSTVADIRLIMAVALKTGSCSMILCHNHPSGNLQASSADVELTKKIMSACKFLDIVLLDHLIVTPDGRFRSLADEGATPF